VNGLWSIFYESIAVAIWVFMQGHSGEVTLLLGSVEVIEVGGEDGWR